ncbi:MAG: hypothetical protein JXR07_10940 [Reichenbachiella sp.]
MKSHHLLLILFCVLGNFISLAQGIQFNNEFAPQEGLIKSVEKPYRDEICLNGSWQFMPIQLKEGLSFEEIKNQELPGASGWDSTPAKIPSPWNVNGFTNGQGGDFRAFPSYPESWNDVKSGWLKKTINVPADWAGNRLRIHFEAVAGYAKVFVNGSAVGDHFDSFLPFNFDVTDHAQAGEELEVLVWVAHGSLLNDPGKYGRRNYVAGSFWGIHIAGIWQDVYLQKLPTIYVADTYIKPLVDENKLDIEVTIKNTSTKDQKIDLKADIKRWINLNGSSVLNIPEVNWTLGESKLTTSETKLTVAANSTQTFTLSKTVDGALDYWSPDSPNLYGLVLSVNQKKRTLDIDYTRFGWRQFQIKDTELLLNGEPFQVKGDSWHFMGIPQMTRRYAHAWYQMLLDGNANGLRLHAQVFPRFYLEMADEMGICVLDETAIWSSDGGPKIDSEIYWEACRTHVKDLVLRDRNYPSVFGWSVCNETLPVTKHVFNAPQELIDRNIQEINEWVSIVEETDPTRTWISGDGETQAKTDLPTVIGHYGGMRALDDWSSQGKPWGIGETGMGYYGTPSQIAKINGDRAYESQLGRMEGLAGEAFDLINKQRDRNASYTCVFNLAWYGLRPLALGLDDVSRPATLKDGIFFGDYIEGKPGYQPERLGPYTSTFNPGYDPTLPLYETWPMFDAVKAAYSDNYQSLENIWNVKKDNAVKMAPLKEKHSVVWLSGNKKSPLKKQFEELAIKFEPMSTYKNQLVIIDGSQPPAYSTKTKNYLLAAMQKGSAVVFWGTSDASKEWIEELSGSSIDFHDRPATSYLIKGEHGGLNKLGNASFYFSELTKEPVSTTSISGPWVDQSQLILEACNTDWLKWNYNGEDIKTGRVYRSERESKAPGNVIVRERVGNGELIVSTLDLFKLGNQGYNKVGHIIRNLGGTFKGKALNIPTALNDKMELQNALLLGSFNLVNPDTSQIFRNNPLTEDEFTKVRVGQLTEGIYWNVSSANENAVFDYMKLGMKHKQNAIVYLSFWMYSPRSLTDLLIEPDMPRLDMHFGMDDALAFSVNGKSIKEYIRQGALVEDEFIYEGFPLEKGWNHILIKVVQGSGDWKSKIRFSSTKPNFLKEIKSIVDR